MGHSHMPGLPHQICSQTCKRQEPHGVHLIQNETGGSNKLGNTLCFLDPYTYKM